MPTLREHGEYENMWAEPYPHPLSLSRSLSVSENPDRSWQEEGLAVFYGYKDLEKQGLLSSDTARPFKRVLPRILEVARRYKQVYITIYYPHTFGQASPSDNPPKPIPPPPPPSVSSLPEVVSRYSNHRPAHRYTNILREVVPTRTGLDQVKSTCVVWLSKVNGGEPRLADEAYLASIVFKREPDGGEL